MTPVSARIAFSTDMADKRARRAQALADRMRPQSEPQCGGLTALKSLLPRVGITQRTLKKLEVIQLVREQRDAGKQELAYNARPFVL